MPPEGPATSAAPAQPVASTPKTQPATRAAVASGSTSAYRTARRAERLGKPLPEAAIPTAPPAPTAADPDGPAAPAAPAPPAAAAPAAPAPPEPQLSKRQQEINERAQRAVEAATTQLREEVASLRAQLQARPSSEPAAPAAPKEPEYKRFAALPDAPKLADFDSIEEHTAAMAFFIAKKVQAETHAASARDQASADLSAAQHKRVETFVERLNTTKTADPTFVTKLSAEVRALKPFGALQPGEQGGPVNVVAEQIFDSPIAPQVMLHFSEHPEDLTRLATMPPEIQRLPAHIRVRAHCQWIVREFAKIEGKLERPAVQPDAPAPPKVITDAPKPAETLGTRPAEAADPKTAAIKRGDTSAYRQIRLAERRAALGR